MSNKTKQVVELTTEELVQVLKTVPIGQFGYIEMNTIPKMRKTNNDMFGRVVKTTKLNMFFGCNYQKRMIKETNDQEFVPQECRVGKRIETSCVYYNENHNRYYFQFIFV